MKKFALAALCMFVAAGITLAAMVEIKSVDVEKKEIVVKDGDKEKTYKWNDKTKVLFGDKEVAADKLEGALKRLAKSAESGKAKADITVEKDIITELKLTAGKKGKDKN